MKLLKSTIHLIRLHQIKLTQFLLIVFYILKTELLLYIIYEIPNCKFISKIAANIGNPRFISSIEHVLQPLTTISSYKGNDFSQKDSNSDISLFGLISLTILCNNGKQELWQIHHHIQYILCRAIQWVFTHYLILLVSMIVVDNQCFIDFYAVVHLL